MTYSTPRPFAGWRDQASFLLRRFLRIYPAYWAIAVPLLLVWLVYPQYINASQGNHVDVPASILLMPSNSIPVLGVAWTLVFEIYFYCVISFIFYLGGAGRIIMAAVWGLVVVVRNIIHPEAFSTPFLSTWLSPLTLEFIAGVILAHYLHAIRWRIPTWAAVSALIFAAMSAFYWGTAHGRYMGFAAPVMRLAVYGLPALITVWIVLKMEVQGQWKGMRDFVWLGDRSYSTYLVHLPFIASLLLLCSKWAPHLGGMEVLLLTLLLLVLLNIPIELCYRLVEKPAHLLAKRLARRIRST